MFSTDVWFCSEAEAAVKGHDMSENAKCDAKHAEIEGKKHTGSHTAMNKGVSRTVHIIVVNGPKTRSSSIKCINLFEMENGAKVKIKIWANIIFRLEWTAQISKAIRKKKLRYWEEKEMEKYK